MPCHDARISNFVCHISHSLARRAQLVCQTSHLLAEHSLRLYHAVVVHGGAVTVVSGATTDLSLARKARRGALFYGVVEVTFEEGAVTVTSVAIFVSTFVFRPVDTRASDTAHRPTWLRSRQSVRLLNACLQRRLSSYDTSTATTPMCVQQLQHAEI